MTGRRVRLLIGPVIFVISALWIAAYSFDWLELRPYWIFLVPSIGILVGIGCLYSDHVELCNDMEVSALTRVVVGLQTFVFFGGACYWTSKLLPRQWDKGGTEAIQSIDAGITAMFLYAPAAVVGLAVAIGLLPVSWMRSTLRAVFSLWKKR